MFVKFFKVLVLDVCWDGYWFYVFGFMFFLFLRFSEENRKRWKGERNCYLIIDFLFFEIFWDDDF